MQVATVRETANFKNNTNAVTPYTLGQVLAYYATESYVTDAIAHAQIDPSQVDLHEYAKKIDLPTKLSQLTNDDNYVQTVSGVIPSALLPSYVDDVLEFDNKNLFPNPGESGKIYVALDTNLTYRWGGSEYVEISKSLALGTTGTTAFRGDYGNIAYQHSQATGNPHNLQLSDLGILVSSTEINYLAGLTDTVLNLLAQKLNLSGGTLTGFLTLHADPTQRMHAATKDYVDKEINGISVTVTQNVTKISELTGSVDDLTTTVGAQADTLVEVENSISGLDQTTQSHTEAITNIEQTVGGLTTTVSETQTAVTHLEASVNQLATEFVSQSIFVLVDSDKCPLDDATYTLNYQCRFRGNAITPDSVTINGSNTGITTSQETNKIKFTVDNSVAIPNEINNYSVVFTYVSGGFTWTLTKNLAVMTVPQGEAGPAGQPGPQGKSVTSIQEMYYKSTSSSQMIGGTWVTIYPGWTTGYYIWTKTRTLYSDSTYEDTEPVMVTDTTTGWTTIEGIGITNVDVWYYLSTSNQTLSGGSWQSTVPAYDSSKFLWTKTRTTYSNGFSDESAPMCVSGQKGEDGTAVSSLTIYYKTVNAGSSAPAKPTVDTPQDWSTSEPALDTTKDLYATLKTTYTDNTFYYSDPQKYSSYEAAKTAYNTANTANTNATEALSKSVEKSSSAPTNTDRIWLDLTTGLLKQYDSNAGAWIVINDFSSSISGLSDDIRQWNETLADSLDEARQYADNAIITSRDTQWQQTTEYFEMQFNSKTETINSALGDIQTTLQQQASYINFANGIITLGETGNAYTLQIDNDRINVLWNEVPISSWIQDIFQAKEIDIGPTTWDYKFSFVPNADGSLSFRKVSD